MCNGNCTGYPSTTGSIDYSQSCGSRLPCGVCMITGDRCPLMPYTVTPTWMTTTTTTMEVVD